MKRNHGFSQFLIGIAALGLSGIATAGGVFKWVDKQGQVHYSTSRPQEENVRSHEPDPIDWRARQKQTPAPTNVHPRIPDPGAHGPRDSEPITLRFMDVDIASLFAIFADFSRHRLDIDPSIHKRVSVNYVDAPWEATMMTIAADHGLKVTRADGVIAVRKK